MRTAFIYDPLVLLKAFVVGIVAAIVLRHRPGVRGVATPPAIAMRAQGFEQPHSAPGAPHRTRRRRAAARRISASRSRRRIDDIPVFGYAAGLLIIFGGSLFAPLAIAGARGGRDRGCSRTARPPAKLAAANLGVVAGAQQRRRRVADDRDRDDGQRRDSRSARSARPSLRGPTIRSMPISSCGRSASPTHPTMRVLARRRAHDRARAGRRSGRHVSRSVDSVSRSHYDARRDRLRRRSSERNKLRFIGVADTARAGAHACRTRRSCLISEPFATKFQLDRGDSIHRRHAGGADHIHGRRRVQRLLVPMPASCIMDRAHVRAALSRSIGQLDRRVRASRAPIYRRLRSAIVRAVLPLRIDAETTRELRELVIEIFDRTFAITYALYIISITIAVLGVVSHALRARARTAARDRPPALSRATNARCSAHGVCRSGVYRAARGARRRRSSACCLRCC